ncbi:hypothetical protein EBU71_13780 [bacterium]|jgi:hypothetical protein|nr:hypothetical protein [Candidatus Elulimicrobium humile]
MSRINLTRRGWKAQIQILENYCNDKGWDIEWVSRKDPSADTALIDKNRIYIKKERNNELTFYILLHEIGHMMLCQNNRMYEERYNAVFEAFSRASITHKIKRVEEELDAWKTGYKLSKRLKLYVNRRRFEQIKSRCVTTYMMWAVDRKIKKDKKQNGSEQRGEIVNEQDRSDIF